MIHVGWRYKNDGAWVYVDGTTDPNVTDAEKVFTEASEIDINEALIARGMYTVAELLNGELPTDSYKISRDVTDYDSFTAWLEAQAKQYTIMRLRYETGFEKQDDMYEWVFSHSAAYKDVILNWKNIHNKTKQSP